MGQLAEFLQLDGGLLPNLECVAAQIGDQLFQPRDIDRRHGFQRFPQEGNAMTRRGCQRPQGVPRLDEILVAEDIVHLP